MEIFTKNGVISQYINKNIKKQINKQNLTNQIKYD